MSQLGLLHNVERMDNMKKLLTGIAILAAVVLTGCATPYPQGLAYLQLKLPVAVSGDKAANLKVGKAECRSVLGLVATGDASIDAAAKNGGITVIHHVDWEVENVFGLLGIYRCVVYGE